MSLEKIISRVNKVDSCYIPHTAIDDAIKGIERCILLSEGAKEPVNVMLTGHSGTGKTTACNAVLSKRKRKHVTREDCEVTLVPAFYALVPNPVTIKGVASALLNSLGDPDPTRGTALAMTLRLGRLLKTCETQVIILDELQHLLKHDHKSTTNNVKDWLKTLINEFKVPIVIVGTPQCSDVINTDSQLERRFTTRFELNNLNFGGQDKGDFRIYVEDLSSAFKKIVKIESFPDFKSQHNSLMIYVATGGNPADINNLFKTATIYALENGEEHIKLTDFEYAFNHLVLPNTLNLKKSKINPFGLQRGELEKIVKNIASEACYEANI